MGVLSKVSEWFGGSEENRQRTKCSCPECGSELVAQIGNVLVNSGESHVVVFECRGCLTLSRWDFAPPVPLNLGPVEGGFCPACGFDGEEDPRFSSEAAFVCRRPACRVGRFVPYPTDGDDSERDQWEA